MHEVDLAIADAQPLLERACDPITSRLCGHRGRFVDSNPLRRLPDDGQLRQLLSDRDAIPLAHLARRHGHRPVIDEHPLLPDQLPRLAPRDLRLPRSNGLIETHGRIVSYRTNKKGTAETPCPSG